MARAPKKSVLKGLKGKIGKEVVIKQYSYGTVVTAYPDMSRVKPSKLQKHYKKTFAEAVKYAQSILRDPVKKAAFEKKLKKGERVYNAAIKEFYRKEKNK